MKLKLQADQASSLDREMVLEDVLPLIREPSLVHTLWEKTPPFDPTRQDVVVIEHQS